MGKEILEVKRKRTPSCEKQSTSYLELLMWGCHLSDQYNRPPLPGCKYVSSTRYCATNNVVPLFVEIFSSAKCLCLLRLTCVVCHLLPKRRNFQYREQIVMPHTAVKAIGTKNIVVRNLGTRAASVSLSCEPSGTFSVKPTEVIVPVGTSTQLEIGFNPERSLR